MKTSWREEHGREILMLGSIEVGYVLAIGGKKDRPRWLFALGRYDMSQWRTEISIERARSSLESMLQDWLRRAGLCD